MWSCVRWPQEPKSTRCHGLGRSQVGQFELYNQSTLAQRFLLINPAGKLDSNKGRLSLVVRMRLVYLYAYALLGHSSLIDMMHQI